MSSCDLRNIAVLKSNTMAEVDKLIAFMFVLFEETG